MSTLNPPREWQDEIEAGLHSMDALAAILMPGFKESNWTDQEVGVAVGRGVLVIPIIRGLNPYGFISKFQGLNTSGKKVGDVADELFRILVTSSKTRARMLSCLTETTLQSKSGSRGTVQASQARCNQSCRRGSPPEVAGFRCCVLGPYGSETA